MKPRDLDVCVVGGSIAGALLSLKLVAKGVSVGVIDRGTWPRRKACGEGLSSAGVEILKASGSDNELATLPSHQSKGFCLHDGRSKTCVASSPEKGPLGIQRLHLDWMILSKALRSGVHGYLSAEARSISRNRRGFIIELDNDVIRARYLVVADGVRSLTANRLNCPVRQREGARYGYTLTMKGAFEKPPEFIHVFLRRGWEAYCTPTSMKSMNISLLAEKDQLKQICRGNLFDLILHEVIKEMGFEGMIEGAPLGSSNLGNMRRQPSTDRAILVGDACESFDPLGGMGMTHAVISSTLAADALSAVLEERASFKDAAVWYEMKRSRFAKPLRKFTRVVTFAMRSTAGRVLLKSAGPFVTVDRLVGNLENDMKSEAAP